jgi:hypothetical protein
MIKINCRLQVLGFDSLLGVRVSGFIPITSCRHGRLSKTEWVS